MILNKHGTFALNNHMNFISKHTRSFHSNELLPLILENKNIPKHQKAWQVYEVPLLGQLLINPSLFPEQIILLKSTTKDDDFYYTEGMYLGPCSLKDMYTARIRASGDLAGELKESSQSTFDKLISSDEFNYCREMFQRYRNAGWSVV